MGRKKGFDERKIDAIVGCLVRNTDGIWLRKIAEEVKLHPSTVSKYVETVLRPLIEDVSLAGKNRPYLRIIRLKPGVLERLQQGQNTRQIIKYLEIMNRIEGI